MVLSLIANFILIIGNLIWSCYDMIPFKRIFDLMVNNNEFMISETVVIFIKTLSYSSLSITVSIVIWYQLDLIFVFNILNMTIIPFFYTIFPAVLLSNNIFQEEKDKSKKIVLILVSVILWVLVIVSFMLNNS